jgi:anti-anti-sigma factor
LASDLAIRPHLEITSKLLWKELHLMERHLTTSTVSIGRRKDSSAGPSPGTRSTGSVERSTRKLAARSDADGVSRSMGVWTHTLVLTGELTHRSVHALEAEIERLCDEGVSAITLDLRQLESIDSIGVAVISFRCRLCQRRGHGFEVIAGSRSIQREFEQAGVTDLLPFRDDEVAARRLRTAIPRAVLSRRS